MRRSASSCSIKPGARTSAGYESMSALAAAFAESGHGGWRDRRRPSATCAPMACSRSMCPVGGATIGGLERGPWPDHVPVPAFGPRMVCHYNGRLALRPPHGAGQAHCGRHDLGECGYRATASCRNWSHSWPCSTLAPHAKRSASSSGKMVGAAAVGRRSGRWSGLSSRKLVA